MSLRSVSADSKVTERRRQHKASNANVSGQRYFQLAPDSSCFRSRVSWQRYWKYQSNEDDMTQETNNNSLFILLGDQLKSYPLYHCPCLLMFLRQKTSF